jgi:hypothetical protein
MQDISGLFVVRWETFFSAELMMLFLLATIHKRKLMRKRRQKAIAAAAAAAAKVFTCRRSHLTDLLADQTARSLRRLAG